VRFRGWWKSEGLGREKDVGKVSRLIAGCVRREFQSTGENSEEDRIICGGRPWSGVRLSYIWSILY
jgi:hypothetical protein